MKPFAPVLLFVLFLASPALQADVVYLKNGGKVEGKLTDLGDRVRVETAAGTVVLQRNDIDRIEKKPFEFPKSEEDPGEETAVRLRVRLGEFHTNPFLAYKIRLPAGWKKGEPFKKARASFTGPVDVAYIPRMDLFIERAARNFPSLVAKYRKAFRSAYPDAAFMNEETFVTNDLNGHQFQVRFSEGSAVPMRSLWTLVLADTRLYVLSFSCTEKWFPKYERFLTASMRSLRIYPEPDISERNRNRFLSQYSLGETAWKKNDYAGALKAFREAARAMPEWPDIHGTVGQMALQCDRNEEAEKALRRATELDPHDFTHRYNHGLCLLRLGRNREAGEALQQATELDPESAEARANLGVVHLRNRAWTAAARQLEASVRLDPESAAAHFNLGLSYEGLKENEKALRHFRDAIKLDPDHAGAKEGLKRLEE